MGEAYRMHSACVLHKKTKILYIIGGYRDGEWVSDISKLAFTKNEQVVKLNIEMESLIGPSAVIPETDLPHAIIYISG